MDLLLGDRGEYAASGTSESIGGICASAIWASSSSFPISWGSSQGLSGRRVTRGASAWSRSSAMLRANGAVARGFERIEHLLPVHVGVGDPLVDQGDRAREVGRHLDRLGVDRVGRAHQRIGSVHRVAVDRHQLDIGLGGSDQRRVRILAVVGQHQEVGAQTCPQAAQLLVPPSASAALHVAIAQIACAGNCLLRLLESMCRSATLSSPSRLFDPDGDQSAPRQMRIPFFCAAATSVVLPYSHKLLNGDHTSEPGLADVFHW